MCSTQITRENPKNLPSSSRGIPTKLFFFYNTQFRLSTSLLVASSAIDTLQQTWQSSRHRILFCVSSRPAFVYVYVQRSSAFLLPTFPANCVSVESRNPISGVIVESPSPAASGSDLQSTARETGRQRSEIRRITCDDDLREEKQKYQRPDASACGLSSKEEKNENKTKTG